MKVRPILFSTDMVRAILEKRKLVTRRVVKFPVGMTGRLPPSGARDYLYYPGGIMRPPYEYGDILHVRETWAKTLGDNCKGNITGICPYESCENPKGSCFEEEYVYKAGDSLPSWEKWRPSIHMPKEAARIFLRVKAVQVERLQEITEEQARAEGVSDPYDYQPPEWYEAHKELAHSAEIAAYAGLWNRLYAKPMPVREHGKVVRYESYPWADIQETRTYRGLPWLVIGNPWVWVIEFGRTGKPEGWPSSCGEKTRAAL